MSDNNWINITERSFYFIRHGQTDWNVKHQAMGITDIPLNKIGEKQAQQAATQFKGIKIKSICYSPLKRAFRTAEILNEVLDCQMYPIDEIKEFNLGQSAGKVIGDWFDEWMRGGYLLDGESFHEFVARALSGVNKALAHKGPVLIVAHGGIYWAIQMAINQLDLPDLPNCLLASFIQPKLDKAWKCIHHRSEQISLP